MASHTTSLLGVLAPITVMLALLGAPTTVFADSGRATFYSPDGLGACGSQYPSSYPGAAVSSSLFDLGGVRAAGCSTSYQMTNMANGRTVTVVVVDKCPSCSEPDFDLFPGAFSQIADPNVDGIISITSTTAFTWGGSMWIWPLNINFLDSFSFGARI